MRANKSNFIIIWVILAGALFLFQGCAKTEKPKQSGKSPGNIEESLESLAKRFPKIPFPNNYELDRSRSVVYESGDGRVRIGHLYFKGQQPAEDAILYYRNEMATRDWNLIRNFEQEATVLLYGQGAQICTVTIMKSNGETLIDIQFRPK